MTRRLHADDLYALAVPEQPALSPDGTKLVYSLRTLDRHGDRVVNQLWRVGATPDTARRLTGGDSDTSPAWSPDGSRIAFLRRADGPAQLWVLPVDGGEAEQLTTLALGAGTPVWSPDGNHLAFTAPVDTAATAGEDNTAREQRSHEPVVADRLDYRTDGVGLVCSMRMHVHVVDVTDKSCRQATSGDWHAGDPAWSPDGKRLAFSGGVDDDRDLTYRTTVFVLDAHDPGAAPAVVHGEVFAATACWTADGNALLVAGGYDVGGPATLLRVPLDDAPATDLAGPLDRNVMTGGPAYPGGLPQLSDSGEEVLFCVRDRGCTHVYKVAVDGGAPQPVLHGEGRVVSGLSASATTAVVALTTPTSFGELVSVDLATGAETVRTAHGANLDDIEVYERESREFTISDGTTVQAWLLRAADASGAQPLLLDVHGGPHNAWNGAADEVHLYHQELVARGWTVLVANPRGSDGYGNGFWRAAMGAWGEADAKDLLEPIDTLVAEGIADPARLAVTGYSYGGFMTCYLTSRDDRFAAAVTGGVVSDLTSQNGTSDAAHFLGAIELGAAPWQDPERYERLSPISKVDQVRTPTLIVQGGADIRCPVGQAEQWHTALRERDVPARLVLYPDASHLFVVNGRPSHRVDVNRRVAEWVQRFASDAQGARPAPIDAHHWQRRLESLAAKHKVPGAQLGVLRLGPNGDEDDLVTATHGLLNVTTNRSVTADSLFQIGSISKVWTATVAMQLVDEGKLSLDTPISEVLPELALRDPDVAKQVTLRHLLTHTSGIDGDVFTDTGRGDDCLEKYVGLLENAAQNHPLGATWSYCNSGFSLLGRVIERLTCSTWDAAMRERLFAPLGLEHTVTLPEEVLLHDAAVGHVSDDGSDPHLAPVWQLPRSAGPAGLICSTAADVLSFARLHLRHGVARDGARLLAHDSVSDMAAKHADLPDKYTLGDSWGLGWIRYGWDGNRLIGHDGNTIGQSAFLRVLPDQGLAVTLLTNGGNARDLYQELYREIFAEVADVAMPAPLAPPREPVEVDASRFVGTYERESVRMEIEVDDDGPLVRTTITGPLAELVPDPVDENRLVAVGPDLFALRSEGTQTWTPVTFYSLPNGAEYVHLGARATPKVS